MDVHAGEEHNGNEILGWTELDNADE